MSAKVVPLKMTRTVALRRIRELSKNTANVVRGPEIRGSMRKRKISWDQVIKVLQLGMITEGPYEDIKGCWRCKMERFAAGENVRVVVSICGDELVAITTF